jgi:hypothetical protein
MSAAIHVQNLTVAASVRHVTASVMWHLTTDRIASETDGRLAVVPAA